MSTMLQVIGAWPSGPGSSSWPTWAVDALGAACEAAAAGVAACLSVGRATLSALVPKGQALGQDFDVAVLVLAAEGLGIGGRGGHGKQGGKREACDQGDDPGGGRRPSCPQPDRAV